MKLLFKFKLVLIIFLITTLSVSCFYDFKRENSNDPSSDSHVFKWNELPKLIAYDGYQNDLFGKSVSISGNYAIVGVPQDDDNGPDSGSAHIYKNQNGSWTWKQKITPDDGQSWAEFGWSVSISGDYAIIGAWMDDHDVNDFHEGSAYIFKKNGETWTQIQKLIATEPANLGGGGPTANGRFGFSVFIYNDYAIVGAHRTRIIGALNEGAAYIFEKDRGGTDNWGQRNMINAEDYTDEDYFGYSVSISDDYALVGAPYNDGTGSVYIFKRDISGLYGWGSYHSLSMDTHYREYTESYKFTSSDGAASDQFGYSVSISEYYGMVGAPYNDGIGSVYVLFWNGTNWVIQSEKITPSDGLTGDEFGISVSSTNDTVIAGAWNNNNTGSAYIFNRSVNSWIYNDKFLSTDAYIGDKFGVSVSISDNYSIIGAHQDDDKGDLSGSAYIFKYY